MHIAISGRLGSGKSTVCKILADKYGFDIYSTGKIQRGIAEEMGITTLELNKMMVGDNQLDNIIDSAVAEISEKTTDKAIIFDSRMAFKFAKNAFTVYVYADMTVAARRVMGDSRGSVEKYESVEDAKAKLLARSLEENRRYKELYHVNNFDYQNYDLIVDSTYVSAEYLAEVIYSCYKSFEGKNGTKMLLSPYSVYPTVAVCDADGGSGIGVVQHGGYNFALSGHRLLLEAIKGDEALTECYISDAALPESLDRSILADYEQSGELRYTDTPDIYK